MIEQIELWAQQGMEEPDAKGGCLGEELRSHVDVEWDIETVAAFMRAAYGRGYAMALTEPVPLDVAEARSRAAALTLMLPT